MYRLLFRLVASAALLIWGVLSYNFVYLSWQFNDLEAEANATVEVAVVPTPTALPLPTAIPPTFEPLPNTAAQADPATSANALTSVHPKTGRYIAAWLPTSFDAVAARATFEANKDVLDEVSPFWYGVYPDGQLIPDVGSRDTELVRIAHENNVLVIPTLHNVNDVEPAATVISTAEGRARHIEIIVDEVMTYNYDGIDIDYEGLTDDMEDEFTTFMTDLSAALHARGKLLTVAVHARTRQMGFQNYADLGKVVDRLRIMTYDYSWRGSVPGPIAPMFWVQEVAEYARSVVDPAKIQIGISFYAYDWGGDGLAYSWTWTEVQEIINDYQPRVNLTEWDGSRLIQESNFNYAGRTVWFSNYRSLSAKLDMVREMDLAGIAIWRLGNEDPENWTTIRTSLQQDPVIVQRTINKYLPGH